MVAALKPSPENLVDGSEIHVCATPACRPAHMAQILGLIWALMMRFMRFHDSLPGEEGSAANMSAKEQLLSWVQHNTQGYAGVSIKNFTSSFSDGLALCAIIHKFRPDLIDFDSLSPADPQHNIATSLAAAQVYFGLDVYLTIPEIMKLDDKSMVVFLGEFYAGITEHAKRGRASERIAKLVQFDQTNDKVLPRGLVSNRSHVNAAQVGLRA